MTETCRWSGEMLWPQALPEAAVIEAWDLTAIGSWSYDWFRSHPCCKVVGLQPHLKHQLRAAGLPVLCYDRLEDIRDEGGVSPGERDLLWS